MLLFLFSEQKINGKVEKITKCSNKQNLHKPGKTWQDKMTNNLLLQIKVSKVLYFPIKAFPSTSWLKAATLQ